MSYRIVPKQRIKPMEKSRRSLSDIVFLLGMIAMAILIPLVVVEKHFLAERQDDLSALQHVVGGVAALGALVLVGFNLSAAYFRPWLYRRSRGSLDGFQHVSGGPILGSLLVFLAAVFLPNSAWIGVILLVLYVADPVGLLMAAIVFICEIFTEWRRHE